MARTIRLLTTWYSERISERELEYELCLNQNLANPFVDQVCILDEGSGLPNAGCPKLQRKPCDARPRYSHFFAWINELASPDDLSIIANTDIWFDESVRMFEELGGAERTVFAVSRWDVLKNGLVRLFERGDSQDVWIVRGKVRDVRGDFPVGVLECDDKIAWEFQQAGYRVVNPALSFRAYHLHLTGYRSYEIAPAPDYGIRPPYLHVEPDNLFGPLTAWRMKRKYGLTYLPWKMTWKRFWRYPIPALVLRVWNKGKRMLRRQETPSLGETASGGSGGTISCSRGWQSPEQGCNR